jgi:hypothetical protein
MTTEQDWDTINSRGACGDTCRLKVPGGWLYRERECQNRDGVPTAVALAFVPELIAERLAVEQANAAIIASMKVR